MRKKILLTLIITLGITCVFIALYFGKNMTKKKNMQERFQVYENVYGNTILTLGK